MSWREIWDSNITYDLEHHNLCHEVHERFLNLVQQRLHASTGSANAPLRTEIPMHKVSEKDDEVYLSECERVLRENHTFLLHGVETRPSGHETLSLIRTLR